MSCLSLRCLLPLLVAIAALNVSRASAQSGGGTNVAPVLVYRVQFNEVLSSINFRGFSGGYYIADVNNGASDSGTLILLQVVGNNRHYYSLTNFGQMFFASDGRTPKALVVGNATSVASTTVAATRTITFFLSSEAKNQIKLDLKLSNGPSNFFIPKELKGQAIFCDSQEDQPFALAPGQAVGTAAEVNVSFKYDEGQTEYSLQRNAGRADMATKLISELKKDKYTQGN
jgi:hypothetical protein